MKVENDTNDPVDYDQAGSGSDDDEGRCKGLLTPRGTPGNSRAFPPCGPKPWSVTFTSRTNGKTCTAAGIQKANTTVRIERFGGCEISIEDPEE